MIIFINGPINAGKSTVAKILAEKIPKTARVEIDQLHEFIDWLEIDQAVPINLENAALVISNFIRRGYNVVVPYPLSEKDYKYMKKQLRDFAGQLYFFTLAPEMRKAQGDTKDRKISPWERERIRHHYDSGIASPSFGKIIDNTRQTPEQTADEILSCLPKDY